MSLPVHKQISQIQAESNEEKQFETVAETKQNHHWPLISVVISGVVLMIIDCSGAFPSTIKFDNFQIVGACLIAVP